MNVGNSDRFSKGDEIGSMFTAAMNSGREMIFVDGMFVIVW